MRTMITLMGCLMTALTLQAQETKTTQEHDLQQVEVKAARIIDKPDGKVILPSAAQLEHAANVYQLLSMMPMQGLKVNVIARTIVPVAPDGSVQIRIDGVKASGNDLAALDVKRIKRIEYIDNPGVRYGDGIKYVVIIHTRRSSQGYDLGLDATNALTDWQGNNTVYGNYNSGNSQFKLSYNFGYKDFKGDRDEQTADYTLSDNSIERVTRSDQQRRNRNFNHDIQLTYNLTDTLDNVFQASLSTSLSHTPWQQNVKTITTETLQSVASTPTLQTATQIDKSHSASPVLDLYLFRHLGTHQTLTANATTTYIYSNDYSSYDELSPYAYWVDGRTWSLWSEAIYANRLKPFTLSTGANYQQKYTDNTYTGDVLSENKTITSQMYLFTQLSGKLWRLSYTAGVGYNDLHYRQGEHSYDYHFFRPKFSLAWKIDDHLSFSYSFESSQWISRVAMVSDTRIRQNAREWTVGNPDLRQPKRMEHTWKLSYTSPSIYNSLMAYYRRNPHCNMALYTRMADDQFLYTQTNQRAINLFYVSDAAQWTVVPDRFIINANAVICRCFNYGDSYKHHYTGYTGGIDAQWFLGKWSLVGSFDGGWRWLEGETKGDNAATCAFQVGYAYKNWDFSLACLNPFNSNPRMNKGELINRDLHKVDRFYSRNEGQKIILTVTWHTSGGKRYREVNRRLTRKADTDTGIIK
jgi:hypothetical protein